jgi:hypothetical protein
MGKTTTIFQIAEGVSDIGNGTPLVVPLGDWATEGYALLVSILKRPAFTGVSEADFRAPPRMALAISICCASFSGSTSTRVPRQAQG